MIPNGFPRTPQHAMQLIQYHGIDPSTGTYSKNAVERLKYTSIDGYVPSQVQIECTTQCTAHVEQNIGHHEKQNVRIEGILPAMFIECHASKDKEHPNQTGN